ncbi:MAG TPA: hypothetical protein VGR72_02660 [Candidatus Acidoferrales bacterium]|nr:hypothetical protein [Candidatus Acidoferrales bacterium]
MATTRIATQPRVSRSKKSANSPHEVQPEVQANDPVLAQARAVADTIRQLERGRIPRDLPKLPLFSDDASSPAPPPERPKIPSKVEGRKPSPRQSGAATPPDLARHRRKCVVCNHADREEIEEQFIQWRHPGDIANDFQIEEARYIRRHAQAVGLYARRRENYLFTLENLLERGDEIELTAAAYIKAVRAYACMCDTVRWTEPAIRVIGLRDSSSRESGATGPEPETTHSTNTLAQAERIVGQTTTTLPPARSGEGAVADNEGTSPDNALCGSGLEPRHPERTRNDFLLRASSAQGSRSGNAEEPSLPHTVPDNSASPALQASTDESPVTNHAAQNLGAGISPTSDIQPPISSTSNRPSPRLETGLSNRKQRKEASSNRP